MAGHEQNPSTGYWDAKDIEATAAKLDPAGSDAFLDDVDRFRYGVEIAIQTRLRNDVSDTKLSVFLHTSHEKVPFPEFKRCRLLSHGTEQIGGRVWLVNAVQAGSYVENNFATEDELLEHITHHFCLGNVPALIVDPAQSKARFYPKGLNEDDNCVVSNLITTVTLDQILERINQIYDDNLLTPEAQSEILKLWVNTDKHWPRSDAEKTIQANLMVGLKTAFRIIDLRPRIYEEQTQTTGRIDLLVTQKTAPHQFMNIAVIELKVLRSYSSSGKTTYSEAQTLDWIKDGLDQAYTYREDREAKESALCCFDMREIDTDELCFAHIKVEAEKLNIKLRRWYIFSTSKQLRKRIVSEALGG